MNHEPICPYCTLPIYEMSHGWVCLKCNSTIGRVLKVG